MSLARICILLSISLLLISPHQAHAKESNLANLEKAKIDFLILRIKESKLCFIRNGKEYNSKQAAKHLKKKLSWARKNFFRSKDITAEEFIDEIASRSSITKEEYLLRTLDAKTITVKEWLKKELKLFPKQKALNAFHQD